ncbi:MAG TPA: SMP-30/gluconolactonase/LRE family protein [Candidatus Saccharimonadales bacterium]|nr:SMP-30/gluconolactonase/LRE family protein [Candidatus Saccharimonadales bacterium]
MKRNSAGLRPEAPIARFHSYAEGLDHPEGLAFDPDGNLWAGGELGQIYKIDGRGKVKEIARLGGFCLGLTFSKKQELFVCNFKRGALIHMNRKGRVLRCIERIGKRQLLTPNFSVFDSTGNLYFSDSGEWNGHNGCVYRLRSHGPAEYFAGPFSFANGLALSADEQALYVVQSQKDNVLQIHILPDGRAGKPRVYASGLARVPDGAALDADGNLYVTTYASHSVYRVAPGGAVSLYASDPEATMLAAPTNAAFGGPNFDELYFANLNRWHICRVKSRVRGQLLANLR